MNAASIATAGKIERVLFVTSLAVFAWALYQRVLAGDANEHSTRFVLLTASLAVLAGGSLLKRPLVRGLAMIASVIMLIAFFVSGAAR